MTFLNKKLQWINIIVVTNACNPRSWLSGLLVSLLNNVGQLVVWLVSQLVTWLTRLFLKFLDFNVLLCDCVIMVNFGLNSFYTLPLWTELEVFSLHWRQLLQVVWCSIMVMEYPCNAGKGSAAYMQFQPC